MLQVRKARIPEAVKHRVRGPLVGKLHCSLSTVQGTLAAGMQRAQSPAWRRPPKAALLHETLLRGASSAPHKLTLKKPIKILACRSFARHSPPRFRSTQPGGRWPAWSTTDPEDLGRQLDAVALSLQSACFCLVSSPKVQPRALLLCSDAFGGSSDPQNETRALPSPVTCPRSAF